MAKRDLIILAADKDAQFGIRALLDVLQHARSIRPILFDCEVHNEHDGGVRSKAHGFLRTFSRDFEHALAIFDFEGCGREHRQTAEEIEKDVEGSLAANGWQDRCAAVVLEPELEAWIWDRAMSPAKAVGISRKEARSLLEEQNFLAGDQIKPARPKEAFQFLLQRARQPRSSTIYADLSKVVDRQNCADRAFNKLLGVLCEWFPK